MHCRFAASIALVVAAAVLSAMSSAAASFPVASRAAGEARIAAAPDEARSYLDYAEFLLAEGDPAAAAAVLERGRGRTEPSADLLTALGRAYQQRRMWNKAESCTRDALALDGDHVGATVQLGEIYLALGWPRSGLDCFRRAVDLAPGDLLPQLRLVQGLCENGAAEEAEDTCLQFIAADPEHAELWVALGRVFEKQGNRREAFTTYGQALTIDASATEAWARQGKLFCEFGQFEAAAQSCRHALGIDPDDPLAHAYLGIALSHLGDGEGARAHAEMAEAAGLNMTAVWRALNQ
jgi:tetratricopeptide (TPR) repeat protein